MFIPNIEETINIHLSIIETEVATHDITIIT